MLRGGAFNNTTENARCAYRNDNDADNRNNNIGFRVVLSTFFATPEWPGGASALTGRGEWRSPFLAAPGSKRAGQIATTPAPGHPPWAGFLHT